MAVDTSVLRGPLNAGSYSKSVAGAAGDVALAADEARWESQVYTGALTGARTVTFPVGAENLGKRWSVENATTGLFSLTVRQPGGAGVLIPQGTRVEVILTANGFRDATTSVARVGSRYIREQFLYRPIAAKVAPIGGPPTGVAGDINLLQFPNTTFEYHVKGTQTIVAPIITAVGLDLGSQDQTAADGIELTNGILSRCPVAFVVGTDPAFFIRAVLKVEDASGCNPLVIGFRKAEAYQATVAAYADYAAIGIIGTADPNTIKTTTEAAGGGNTDTTLVATWADAAVKELKVLVSATGVVTYQINNAADASAVAFSFTAADVVVPFAFFLQAADIAGKVELSDWEVGFQ